jgi:hypothetical protein
LSIGIVVIAVLLLVIRLVFFGVVVAVLEVVRARAAAGRIVLGLSARSRRWRANRPSSIAKMREGRPHLFRSLPALSPSAGFTAPFPLPVEGEVGRLVGTSVGDDVELSAIDDEELVAVGMLEELEVIDEVALELESVDADELGEADADELGEAEAESAEDDVSGATLDAEVDSLAAGGVGAAEDDALNCSAGGADDGDA